MSRVRALALGVVVAGLAAIAGCKTVDNPAWCELGDPDHGCAAGQTCTAAHECVLDGDASTLCEGPAECVAANPAKPLCGATGECVECLGPADCPADRAVCDPSGSCQPCTTSDDCGAWPDGSAAAMCLEGVCLVDAEVAFVDGGAEGCASGDASAASPVCTIDEGVAQLVLRGLTTLLLEGGGAPYAKVELQTALAIVGRGRPVLRGGAGETVIRLRGADADVSVRGVRVTGATGSGKGVVCEDDARCRLVDVEIDGNGVGVEIDLAAAVHLERLLVHDNTAGGISAGRSPLTLASSFIWRNGGGAGTFGGVRLANGPVDQIVVRHLTLLDNGAEAAVAPGIQCDVALPITSTILWDHARASTSAECALTFSSSETLRDGTGNRAGDPLVTATGGSAELHLMPTSPCKDVGAVATGLEPDIDGQPRDATPDMGADEL